MSIRYLLDTNIASYVIKGNVPEVRRRLMRVAMAEVGISVITEAELRFGALRVAKPDLKLAVEAFLVRVETLPWDSAAAKEYAGLRRLLEDSGSPMGNLDMMIAAQALASEVILVTHDKVFERARHLKLEDWTRAA